MKYHNEVKFVGSENPDSYGLFNDSVVTQYVMFLLYAQMQIVFERNINIHNNGFKEQTHPKKYLACI